MGGRGATPEQQFLLKLLSRPSAIFALRPLACFCCDKTFHRQYQYSQGQDKHAGVQRRATETQSKSKNVHARDESF